MIAAKYVGILFLGFIAAATACLVVIPLVWIATALLPILAAIGLPTGLMTYYLAKQTQAFVSPKSNVVAISNVEENTLWPKRAVLYSVDETGALWKGRFALPSIESQEDEERSLVGDAMPNRVPRVPFLFEGME